ncbi:MAG: transposase family protein [Acetomicrobium sp.]
MAGRDVNASIVAVHLRRSLRIIKPRSRRTKYAEKLVLWLLSLMSFKAISKLLKISYGRAKKVLMEA